MRILIVSDTHGHAEQIETIIRREGAFDMLLHAGDVERQEDYIRSICGADCYIVAGNNDWGSSLPRELMVSIGDERIFLTHGHQYGISFGSRRIRDEARSRNASMIVAGHTHRPMIEQSDQMTLLNPGSLTYPRQIGRKPTYIVMEIDREHMAHFSIRELT